VVDTLTPKEDVGIFTFRRDGNINSKNELTKMYSLKEWYAWAQKSLSEPAAAPETPAAPQESATPTPEVSSTVSSTTTASDGASYQYSSN